MYGMADYVMYIAGMEIATIACYTPSYFTKICGQKCHCLRYRFFWISSHFARFRWTPRKWLQVDKPYRFNRKEFLRLTYLSSLWIPPYPVCRIKILFVHSHMCFVLISTTKRVGKENSKFAFWCLLATPSVITWFVIVTDGYKWICKHDQGSRKGG